MSAPTAADVLQEVRFEERLKEVELKVPAALALAAQETSLAKRNQVKRKLYAESELLRVDIEDKLNEHGIEKDWLESPEIAAANAKLNAVRAQLKLDALPMTKSREEQAYMIARFATFVVVFVGWFSAVFVCIPLRWLHPWLRSIGFKNNQLPMDFLSWGVAKLICMVAGAESYVEGRENLENLKDSVICMFSHASNLDGFIVNSSSPVSFKFAAKKSLFMVPFMGWASRWGFGFVAIDRSNRKRALQSLKEMAEAVDKYGRSLAISPEGTRSKDGQLQEFKKGPFYLRDDTKKNVLPAIVFGAYELWPPGRLFSMPGRTMVRFLPEFVPDPSKNRNQNRLELRRIYLRAFAEDVPSDVGSAADITGVLKNLLTLYLIWCITLKVTWTSLSITNAVCAFLGISFWTYAKLSCVWIVALEVLMFFTC
ncbi:TPA: hypothetical protein N0F65_003857 [Lagenidium giganteum]|uniref:Phospholipid/glycerol acyltransferase domain-containing protein n=1 Tax=Lagenidium giganteum TaxID=4803 RepID=A0AAV2ZC56_9STRA|nr:TPA: hypothetical protein N0F65_003857 [Lagenidium giganteum]